MFEPENQIEKDSMKAAVDVGARPAFTRAILDAQVFVVLVPEDGIPVIAPKRGLFNLFR
jgi:hypothetical protein